MFQLFSTEAMDTQTMSFSVNIKAIFCLALVAILTNFVFTQNLYTSPLDDTRKALMSYSSGVSSPKTTPRPTEPPPTTSGIVGGWSVAFALF